MKKNKNSQIVRGDDGFYVNRINVKGIKNDSVIDGKSMLEVSAYIAGEIKQHRYVMDVPGKDRLFSGMTSMFFEQVGGREKAEEIIIKSLSSDWRLKVETYEDRWDRFSEVIDDGVVAIHYDQRDRAHCPYIKAFIYDDGRPMVLNVHWQKEKDPWFK